MNQEAQAKVSCHQAAATEIHILKKIQQVT